METQNLVISFDYSWFLAKNLAYAECRIMKFHYRNSSNTNSLLLIRICRCIGIGIIIYLWLPIIKCFQGTRRKLSLNKAILLIKPLYLISYKFYLNVSSDVHSFMDFCILLLAFFYNICLWLVLSQDQSKNVKTPFLKVPSLSWKHI